MAARSLEILKKNLGTRAHLDASDFYSLRKNMTRTNSKRRRIIGINLLKLSRTNNVICREDRPCCALDGP